MQFPRHESCSTKTTVNLFPGHAHSYTFRDNIMTPCRKSPKDDTNRFGRVIRASQTYWPNLGAPAE
jgi:hypothetical protein